MATLTIKDGGRTEADGKTAQESVQKNRKSQVWILCSDFNGPQGFYFVVSNKEHPQSLDLLLPVANPTPIQRVQEDRWAGRTGRTGRTGRASRTVQEQSAPVGGKHNKR